LALAPEFFVLLGVNIFLASSIVSALLDRHLPSILQYLFQGAAGAGLGELLLGQGLNGPTRVWAGIVYLAFALSSLVGVNIRLAIVRRRMNIASIFSQMLTVPVVMISALLLSSFLENGGELVFSTASIVTIAVAVLVANLSIFGLLREYSRQGTLKSGGLVSLPNSPLPALTGNLSPSFAPHPLSGQEEDWEESPTKMED
jgi:branched-subunit amino acid transport protein